MALRLSANSASSSCESRCTGPLKSPAPIRRVLAISRRSGAPTKRRPSTTASRALSTIIPPTSNAVRSMIVRSFSSSSVWDARTSRPPRRRRQRHGPIDVHCRRAVGLHVLDGQVLLEWSTNVSRCRDVHGASGPPGTTSNHTQRMRSATDGVCLGFIDEPLDAVLSRPAPRLGQHVRHDLPTEPASSPTICWKRRTSRRTAR